MAFLRDVSDRFWNYVSPRKTQQRRDKDFKIRVPPPPQRRKGGSSVESNGMSPDTVIRRWDIRTPTSSGSDEGVNLPPSPPRSLERAYTDFEGETIIDDMVDALKSNEDEDTWDANEETIVVDESRYMDEQKFFDPESERLRRETQGRDLRAAGWTEDAVFLFQKLGMRGFEPLLPGGWINDFDMLPTILFTKNLDKAFIKPTLSPDFHTQKALRDLFDAGPRSRDAVLQKAPIRTAENHILRSIRKYNKWALKDGGLETLYGDISLFEVVSCHKGVQPSVIEEKMLRKLGKLEKQWRDAYQLRDAQDGVIKSEEAEAGDVTVAPDLPTLYGIIASHTIMAFVNYDISATTPSLRTVAMFDFGQETYDVWNSLAIAIFVIHCRNRLMELRESLPEPEEKSSESDPDL